MFTISDETHIWETKQSLAFKRAYTLELPYWAERYHFETWCDSCTAEYWHDFYQIFGTDTIMSIVRLQIELRCEYHLVFYTHDESWIITDKLIRGNDPRRYRFAELIQHTFERDGMIDTQH